MDIKILKTGAGYFRTPRQNLISLDRCQYSWSCLRCAVMIDEYENGKVSKEDIDCLTTILAISHSNLEDVILLPLLEP